MRSLIWGCRVAPQCCTPLPVPGFVREGVRGKKRGGFRRNWEGARPGVAVGEGEGKAEVPKPRPALLCPT